MVRLSTKEVGIVSNIRKNEGPRPTVKIYFNRVNRPITEDKIIDLGVERTIFIEEILQWMFSHNCMIIIDSIGCLGPIVQGNFCGKNEFDFSKVLR